jgi:hypothetical protein
MKYYLIKKLTGEVKVISDGIIGYDKTLFDLKKITTTPEQDDLIKQNYKLKFTDKLEIEEPDHIKEANKKADLKDKISKAKNIDELKELIITKLL